MYVYVLYISQKSVLSQSRLEFRQRLGAAEVHRRRQAAAAAADVQGLWPGSDAILGSSRWISGGLRPILQSMSMLFGGF